MSKRKSRTLSKLIVDSRCSFIKVVSFRNLLPCGFGDPLEWAPTF